MFLRFFSFLRISLELEVPWRTLRRQFMVKSFYGYLLLYARFNTGSFIQEQLEVLCEQISFNCFGTLFKYYLMRKEKHASSININEFFEMISPFNYFSFRFPVIENFNLIYKFCVIYELRQIDCYF